jgi:hypothetical protein
VLVVRARSVDVFPNPFSSALDLPAHNDLEPIVQDHFGWVDGIAACNPVFTPFSIGAEESDPPSLIHLLLRAHNGDPWEPEVRSIRHYAAFPAPASTPSPASIPSYTSDHPPAAHTPPTFPSILLSQTKTSGKPRCPTIVFSSYGTALWIQPLASSVAAGLTALDVHASETQTADGVWRAPKEELVGALCCGPMAARAIASGPDKGRTRIWTNYGNHWTSLAHNEERGYVALGDSIGRVTLLEL